MRLKIDVFTCCRDSGDLWPLSVKSDGMVFQVVMESRRIIRIGAFVVRLLWN